MTVGRARSTVKSRGEKNGGVTKGSILQISVPVHGHVGKLGTLLADKVLQRVEVSRTRARLLTDKGSEVGELISDSLVSTSTLLTFVQLVMPDARIVLSETVVEKFIKV